VAQNPGHPFFLTPLMISTELLKRLQAEVDLIEGGQVSRVTEILPHIENAVLCSKLLTPCNKTLIKVRELPTPVRDAVSQVYEKMR